MIKIRNYTKSDYSKVIGILKEAKLFDTVWESEENLSGKIKNDPESILVSVVDEKIVGCIFIIEYGPKLRYLFRLAVKREFRRQGIASKLLKSAINLAKKKGVKEVGFYVDSDNNELLSLYKKRGFQKSKSKYFYMWTELKKRSLPI